MKPAAPKVLRKRVIRVAGGTIPGMDAVACELHEEFA
jgi:hypothetical protein